MYYPKNKIETNLYSNGEFIVQTTGKTYYGDYYKVSNGSCYTGKEPSSTSLPLTPISDPRFDAASESDGDLRFVGKNRIYSIITNQIPSEKTPSPLLVPFNPQPTKEDYKVGSIERYFAKKRNENVYYELSLTNTKLILQTPMYYSFSVNWTIKGEKDTVYAINKGIVEVTMRKFPIPAFNKFLKDDYLKFWKPS